jgi:hypothetical protein
MMIKAIKLVDDYIQRNPCEFLNPTKTLDNDIKQEYKVRRFFLNRYSKANTLFSTDGRGLLE